MMSKTTNNEQAYKSKLVHHGQHVLFTITQHSVRKIFGYASDL